MRVSTVSALGRVVDYTHANISGERVEIGFNSKYMLDALNAADTDQVRIFKSIFLTDTISPLLIFFPLAIHFSPLTLTRLSAIIIFAKLPDSARPENLSKLSNFI